MYKRKNYDQKMAAESASNIVNVPRVTRLQHKNLYETFPALDWREHKSTINLSICLEDIRRFESKADERSQNLDLIVKS